MREYLAVHGRVNLRILAYRPRCEASTDFLKLVVQVVEDGRPISEDPILSTMVSEAELEAYLRFSLDDGWIITPWKAEVLSRLPELPEAHCGPRNAYFHSMVA